MKLVILITLFSFIACNKTCENKHSMKNMTFAKDDCITLGELEMLIANQKP